MSAEAEPTVTAHPPLLGQGLAGAALAGALLGLEALGQWPLLAGVVVAQVLLAMGVLALLEAPAARGVLLLSAAAAVSADVVIAVDDGSIEALSGVLGLTLVAGLLHQLVRRDRQRVVESLAATLVIAGLVCMMATLTATPEQAEGPWPLRIALAAAGLTLLAGRLGDRFLPRPGIATTATRSWPGLGLGLVAGVLTAVLVNSGHLAATRAALIGLVAVSVVAGIDLALDLAATELSPSTEPARRIAALRPVSVLLPFAALAPVVLLVMRLLSES
ncbi:MAG: conserved rane protein of unknown function [Frankiales bacterium]|nr:conserved rane protein of unknown function [Frankiales bacterium]